MTQKLKERLPGAPRRAEPDQKTRAQIFFLLMELVSDIMRRLVCRCWSAGAGLRVLVCGLCRCALCWRAADPPESHCARHLEE